MNIMILGGTGFIGSHLTDELILRNHDLILLGRTKSKFNNIFKNKKNLKFELVDIIDTKAVYKILKKHKPDTIIHLAGQTSHSTSFENPFYDLAINSKSTLNFLEGIRKFDLKSKFILGSTFIVVGKPTRLPINENSPCNPNSPYAINRLASEYYCKTYHDVYGLDTRIFRITNSFGPREQIIPTKNALNFLIHEAYLENKIKIFNQGKFFRDVIYISDVINGIKSIMRKAKSGHLYWIASGKKTWFYQIAKLLEELTNVKIKYVSSPKYTKKVDVGNFLVDNSKIKSLGWKPLISVKDGIMKTLNYFKENGL